MSARVALVTGAAGGIGAAIVARLEAGGWAVHGVDLADADLSTAEGNRAVVDAALERFGRLDAVIPNAGLQHVAPVAEFPEERWEELLAVLLTSPFLLAKYAWEALAASGDGRFVCVASAHALVASPFKAGYVAAKHGLLGLVKVLALEGAERGILATAVCPAFVRTPLVEAQIAAQARAHGLPEDRVLLVVERDAQTSDLPASAAGGLLLAAPGNEPAQHVRPEEERLLASGKQRLGDAHPRAVLDRVEAHVDLRVVHEAAIAPRSGASMPTR